jgi:hypothetical protein
MVDDLVNHFFEVYYFMDRCLKFKCKMEDVMAPYKDVYNDMQKKTKQPKITSFTRSCVTPPPPCSLCCSVTLTTFSQ